MTIKYNIASNSDKLESTIVYLLARFALAVLRIIPRSVAESILDVLASLVYWMDAKHRHIAHVNLAIAFPDFSPVLRRRIARRGFQSVARNLLEISHLPFLTSDNISKLVEYDDLQGLNNYERAYARGKPILYLTGHFSAWELLPTAHALYGHPLSFVTRPLDNAPLECYLLKIREMAGNRVISKKNSARLILETLKKPEGSVGILMDQNTSLQEGVFVNFFGIPAATTSGIALFALRTDATVLPGFLTSKLNGRYRIKFLPPVDLIRTGDMSRDIILNTRRFSEILEGIIREQPDTWLWGHMRWKNQPEGNPANLYELSEDELESFLKRARNSDRTHENICDYPAG